MKKLLYGTTALVAAGLVTGGASAADKVKLGLGGYFQWFYVGSSQDDGAGEAAADFRSHGIWREGEVFFTGSTTLDNGLTFGANIQLEAETCGDQIDESFLFIEGNFGRVNIGAENPASGLMAYGAPGAAKGHGIDSPNVQHAGAGANSQGGVGTYKDISGDREKITYFTPRFGGFQLGVSYAPDACEFGTTDCAGGSGGIRTESDAGQLEDVLDFGANYVGDFGGFGVNLSAGYTTADLEAPSATQVDDRTMWRVGGNVSVAGFTFGAAYQDDDQGIAGEGDRTDYTIGVGWSGENSPFSVALQYGHGETEIDAGGEDEVDGIELSASYALGPGISLDGGIQFWDIQDNAGAAASENEATIFFVGTQVNF